MKRFLLMMPVALLLLAGCNQSQGEQHPEYCEITFKNYDASVLFFTSVKYGENAVYQGETPKRPSDSLYDYTFTGWDKPLENIRVDTTFIAQYESTAAMKTCNFYDDNGELLYTTTVPYGGNVEYKGEKEPSKKANVDYYYVFAGWDKPLTNITENTDFNPVFTNEYNIKSLSTDHIFKVFQNVDEPDEFNTNFLNVTIYPTAFFSIEFKEPVYYGLEQIMDRTISCKYATFDYSKVNFAVIGEYDLSATYHGVTWNGKIKVVRNAGKLTLKKTYVLNAYNPMMFYGDTIDVYEEGYAAINSSYCSYDKFDLFVATLDETAQTLRLTNEENHTDVIYSLEYSSAVLYKYPEYESAVATYDIVSDIYVPMKFIVHKSIETDSSFVGRIMVKMSDDYASFIDVFYCYDSSDLSMDIKLPIFEHKLAFNSEGKLVY